MSILINKNEGGDVQVTYPDRVETLFPNLDEEGGGGITPTGTKNININQNGTTTHDVTQYASAKVKVNVPTGVTPTGTKNISISQNGTTTEDVADYANAQITVSVPQPSGTKEISITQNGTTTENVADYASAQITVNVPSSGTVITYTQAMLQNSRASGIMTCIRITYWTTTTFGLACYSDGTINNGVTTGLKNFALFDGRDIIFHTSYNPVSVTYDNENLPYITAGSGAQWDVRITLPVNFDNTIPLVFT